MKGCPKRMVWGRNIVMVTLLGAVLMLDAAPSPAEPPGDESCRELAAELADQNQALAKELRRVHREIAALRADLGKPGLQEIFSGIGYILGIFGAAAFAASRRRDRTPTSATAPHKD